MQPGGARHLRETLHGALDVLAGDHHQVGHLVHDHHDERQRLEVELLVLVDGFAAFLVVAGVDGARELLAFVLGLGHARVVAVDVAHTELRHLLVALFHLAHGPFERDHGLLWIGDHRSEQVRDAVVDGELEHFRVDHDQPALFRPQPVEQAQDHGVDGDRLAGSGGAGDQQMRHAREIDDDRFAADRLAEAERQFRGGVDIVVAGELLAQIDLLTRRVRQLDADGIASGDHGDARRQRAHGAGDVVGESDHARRLDAGCGLELIERDHRARPGIDDLAAHAEVAEHALEGGGIGLQRIVAEHRPSDGFRRGEELERRQHIAPARLAWRARRRFRLAPRRRRRLVFVLVDFLRLDLRLQRGARALFEARFGPLTHHRSVAPCRSAGSRPSFQSAGEPGLETEETVGDPAERYGSAFALVLDRLVDMAFIAPPSHAGRDRKAHQRSGAGYDGDCSARQTGQRAARKQSGEPQHPVADDPAEADRQRPGRAARERRGAGGGQQHREDAEQQPNTLAHERPVRCEPPAPNGDRQDQRERGHTEKLDQEVGDDGPRYAEHIAHRRIGGMAERRILHRPGREREREQGRDHDQREPAKLAQSPAQRVAQGLGKEGQAVKTAIDCRHAPPQPSTATRRCSACAVVSWSCTMATRM